MTDNRTKRELEAEVISLKDQIKVLELQIARRTDKEKNDQCALQMHDLYMSFINAGFTESQAWTLVLTLVNNSTTKKSIF